MIDWDSVANEAAELLSAYLKINSFNPPGDERATGAFLSTHLRQRSLESTLYSSAPNRLNLVARLRGDGTKKPILLYNHMDVVEADSRRWSCDPLGGEIRDGYVWGRGAIDMKGMGIMQMLALDLLQRYHPRRSRDILFFSAADEEEGGKFGTQWMIENHWADVEAEYVWDEGGFGLQGLFGPRPVFTVAVADKKDLWLKLVAHGEPGHSGIPHADNAINILMCALERVQRRKSDYELQSVPRRMFADVGAILPFPQSLLLKNLDNPLFFRLALPSLTASPTIAAMLKDTMSITVLQAGGKENIIPDRAEAVLDLRLLPDRDPGKVLDELQNLIHDKAVDIQILQAPQPAVISDMDSELFHTLAKVSGELAPGSITTPMLSPGTTDSSFFRQKGARCYGLFPAIIGPSELARFHGIDERISIENLRFGTRMIYQVLCEMTEEKN